MTPFGPEDFARLVPVSRETLDRLQRYAELLKRWNQRINLVGPNTIGALWRRHLLDCAQLAEHLPPGARRVIDLGSGAGLPGLVLAMLGVEDVHLIEADQRKCAFLREAIRVAGVKATLHPRRIETVAGFPADAVTARALAPLPALLALAEPFLAPHTVCLFLKGQGAEDELTEAAKLWKMAPARIPSHSDPTGIILRLADVRRDRRAVPV